MSRPRPVYPGQCYLVTRRCSERRFFLRPDKTTNNAFWYVLAWAARKHNIGIVAACAMSNHYHLVVFDKDGCFPDFLRDFNAFLARCLNNHRGHWEAFWDPRQTSMVLLADEDAQVDKAVYTLTNPVKDDLVQFAHSWPGATAIAAIRGGRTIVAQRPSHFFRDKTADGQMPERVEVQFVPPPAFVGREGEFLERLNAGIAEAEASAEAQRVSSNSKVMGRKSVLAQRWDDNPLTRAQHRELSPRVASRDKWARIAALQRNKTFEALYRVMLEAYRAGLAAVFPAGTWLMVKQHRVQVDSA